jgi:hypothetical protein
LNRFYLHVAHGIGEVPSLLQGWRREAVGAALSSFVKEHGGAAAN